MSGGLFLTFGLGVVLATACGGTGGAAATGAATTTTSGAAAPPDAGASTTTSSTAFPVTSTSTVSTAHPATVNTTFILTIVGTPAPTDAFSVYFANPGLGQNEYVFCSPLPHSPCQAKTYKISLDSAYRAGAVARWKYQRTFGNNEARQTTDFKQGTAPLNDNYSVSATYNY